MSQPEGLGDLGAVVRAAARACGVVVPDAPIVGRPNPCAGAVYWTEGANRRRLRVACDAQAPAARGLCGRCQGIETRERLQREADRQAREQAPVSGRVSGRLGPAK